MAFESQITDFSKTKLNLINSIVNCGKITAGNISVTRIKPDDYHPTNSLELDIELLSNESNSNGQVVFCVKEANFTIKRSILKENAPLFSEIFQKSQKFRIKNDEPDVFAALLNYIENGEMNRDFLNKKSIELLLASEKYKLDKMKKKILDFISENPQIEGTEEFQKKIFELSNLKRDLLLVKALRSNKK